MKYKKEGHSPTDAVSWLESDDVELYNLNRINWNYTKIFYLCSLFKKNPELLKLFITVGKDFPEGTDLENPEKIRQSKSLRQHGATVLRVLDSFIEEVEPGKSMRKHAQYVVGKHSHLRELGFTGAHFLVCFNSYLTIWKMIKSLVFKFNSKILSGFWELCHWIESNYKNKFHDLPIHLSDWFIQNLLTIGI